MFVLVSFCLMAVRYYIVGRDFDPCTAVGREELKKRSNLNNVKQLQLLKFFCFHSFGCSPNEATSCGFGLNS